MKLWLYLWDEFQVSTRLIAHAVTKWKPTGMRNTGKGLEKITDTMNEERERQCKIVDTSSNK